MCKNRYLWETFAYPTANRTVTLITRRWSHYSKDAATITRRISAQASRKGFRKHGSFPLSKFCNWISSRSDTFREGESREAWSEGRWALSVHDCATDDLFARDRDAAHSLVFVNRIIRFCCTDVHTRNRDYAGTMSDCVSHVRNSREIKKRILIQPYGWLNGSRLKISRNLH